MHDVDADLCVGGAKERWRGPTDTARLANPLAAPGMIGPNDRRRRQQHRQLRGHSDGKWFVLTSEENGPANGAHQCVRRITFARSTSLTA